MLDGFRDVRIVEERFPVKSRLHGGWKGAGVQHAVRRHVQRAAARAGAPLRLAPARVLPQMNADQIVKRTPSATTSARASRRRSATGRIAPAWRARVCERHRGIGADGLIVYSTTPARRVDGAAQRRRQLLGGLGQRRALPGRLDRVARGTRPAADEIDIETDAGVKRLELLERRTGRYTFRAVDGRARARSRRARSRSTAEPSTP